MSQPLSASVVGGGVGGRLSLSALHQSPRYRLVAAVDLRSEVRTALETEFPGLKTFASHTEMFAAAPTDVVCVSTYAPSHEPIVREAVQLSTLRGMLVEKPLGDTAAAGAQIMAALKGRNLPFVVPHGLRAKATTAKIIDQVRSGIIGDLKLIEIQCDKWDLINAGIHWLDFSIAAANAPVRSVLAAFDTSTRTYRDGMEVETVGVTYIECENGVRIILQDGDFVRVNREGKGTLFRLVGSAGIIEFWGWESPYFLLNAQHPGGEIITPEEFAVSGHQRHLEALADQIESGVPNYSLPENSLAALEVIEAAVISYKHRCQVIFPLKDFVPPPPSDWLPTRPYSGTGGGRDGRKLE